MQLRKYTPGSYVPSEFTVVDGDKVVVVSTAVLDTMLFCGTCTDKGYCEHVRFAEHARTILWQRDDGDAPYEDGEDGDDMRTRIHEAHARTDWLSMLSGQEVDDMLQEATKLREHAQLTGDSGPLRTLFAHYQEQASVRTSNPDDEVPLERP